MSLPKKEVYKRYNKMTTYVMQYEFESSYIIVTFRKTLNMVIVYVKQNLWKISRTTLCLTVIENIKSNIDCSISSTNQHINRFLTFMIHQL